MVYFNAKTIIFQGSRERGSNIFQGVQIVRGIPLIIPLDTYRTCNVPGGGPDPHPTPLEPHIMCISKKGCIMRLCT